MRILFLVFSIMLCLRLEAQQTIIAPKQMVKSSFAIFVDQDTYNACKEEIEMYRDVLQREGLAPYILSAKWESPEHIKFFLMKYYKEQALEGAVFIGDIPVPMIRRAQHLTSAFKMDQDKYPLFTSSVPSDRFYDDFNLKFNFVGKDSINHNFYYYNLTGDSPQKISCNIYTGRIKAIKKGEEGYAQIRAYLKKVVTGRGDKNPLDKICSYTGEGSFSNSLIAWKEEAITLKEQIPEAFKDSRNARFYLFNMKSFMKEDVINELRRDDLDLMLFHEHGMPERQYLTGQPSAYDRDEYFEMGKLQARQYLRRQKQYNSNVEEAKKKLIKDYGIDSIWFSGAFDQKVISQDSLLDLKTGIILEDVPGIKPNPRVVVFDACFNGDFRNDNFIANAYIFSEGKTIACFANSVNVLQDKSSVDLMGLLACGYRIGEWTKHINILESHIIGDPTYRFAAPEKLPVIRLNSKDTTYWSALLEHKKLPVDIQSLALYKLFDLEYPGLSKILYKTFMDSKSYTQRLQCMHLLAYYNDDYYSEMLKVAVDDPYEFIRRKAAFYMGKIGRNEFIPFLVRLYMDDGLSERVAFNIINSFDHYNCTLYKNAFKKDVFESPYIFDKQKYWDNLSKSLDSKERLMTYAWTSIIDPVKSEKERLFNISILRNNPYPQMVDDILVVVSNRKESLPVRLALAEALGWYNLSMRKSDIIAVCSKIIEGEPALDRKLADELLKTINRLKTYMR